MDVRVEKDQTLVFADESCMPYSICGENIRLKNQTFRVQPYEDDRIKKADTNGVIHKVHCEDGEMISQGQVVMEIEAMKMVMQLRSSVQGIFRKIRSDGDLVCKDDVLYTIDTDAYIPVQTSVESNGTFDVSCTKTFTFTSVQDMYRTYPNEIPHWVHLLGVHRPKRTTTSRSVKVDDVFHSLMFTFDAVCAQLRDPDYQPLRVWDCSFDGLDVIVVGNNMSEKAGSMSHETSQRYYQALHDARTRKCPFVYLSGTAGAQLMMCDQALAHMTYQSGVWTIPNKYFDAAVMVGEPFNEHFTTVRHFIGHSGVENLSGSALIAGEMARAYREILTITYAYQHTVGIGAYLARLSGRVIQHRDSTLLLTGAKALNNLLGQTVYQSNHQLGGVNDIMGPNGIAQVVVESDDEGVMAIHRMLVKTTTSNDGTSPVVMRGD